MSAPPGRRRPEAAITRATATSNVQADEAKTQRTTGRPQNGHDALELFGAVASRNAYTGSTEVVITMPEPEDPYVRGPGPRPATSSQDDAGAPAYWWSEAEHVVMALIDADHRASADDLHERYSDEPSASGAAFGAIFARLAKAGRIVEVGWARSTRPEARNRRVVLWGRP